MYRFGVDADTTSAEEKLQRIANLMDQIDAMSTKAESNYFYSSQKDIDDNIKAMRELIKVHKELDRQMSAIKSEQASMGNTQGIKQINQQMNDLNRILDHTRNKFQQTAESRQNMSGLNRKIIQDQERFNMELGDEVKQLREIRSLNNDIRNTQKRVTSRAQAYGSAGRLTANQAKVFQGDMDTLDSAQKLRAGNEERINAGNQKINMIDQQLRELAKDPNKNDQKRLNEASELQRLRKATEDNIKALQEMNTTIRQSAEIREQAQNRVNGASVDADPKTIMGQISSRAPSIAIAVLGAFAGVFGSMYARGSTANSRMREPSISIGQRTGQSDFRAVRKQAQEMGLEKGLGYKGADMLGFQDAVLGSMGFTDNKSLNESMYAMAQGGRAVPVEQEQLTSFMQDTMRDGTVTGPEQIKAMQEAFLGAIEQSGMVGREEEQLDALMQLNQSLFSGRNGNQEELGNLMALQSMLSEKGGRSLQGEKGAEALQGLDQGLKDSVSNNKAKLLFGRGTKFQGLGDNFLLEEQLEKGIGDPENLRTMFNSAKGLAGEGASQEAIMGTFKIQARELFGSDLTADQVRGMYEATDGGSDLTKEALAKAQAEMDKRGAEKFGSNAEDYKNSKEALSDRAEAVSEKQASYLNDFGDVVKSVTSSMGGLPSLLYAFSGAVLAATGALTLSAGMSGISTLLKKGTSSTFGKVAGAGAGAGAGGGFLASMGSMFKSGKAGGGWMGGLKSAGGFAKDSALFKGTELADKARGIFSGGQQAVNAMDDGAGAIGGLSKAGGFLGKAGTTLGKVAPWLAVGASAYDIATSDDKVKATGKNAGMFGGAVVGGKSGAMLGATLGSVVPGLGTAVGAGVGSVAGSIGGAFLGSKAGEAVVNNGRKAWDWSKDKLSNFFGGEDAYASEIQAETMGTGKKTADNRNAEEKDTADRKLQSEKHREKNVMDEGANLSLYETLLSRAQQLLTQARAQNGIFGKNGGAGGGSGQGVSGDGSLGTIGDGKKWTNTDITKHDLGQTVMGLNAKELDAWIDSVAPKDSPMRGMGSMFIQAGEESGLDPRYLVAHSALETGWGSSNLSLKGDKEKGNWFGIGAFDDNPDNGFNYGLGLTGGAKWIAENYYNNGQGTLSGMVNDPGGHNYATDPDWANKIASIMQGSDKFTNGSKAQTFATTNEINITVASDGDQSKARAIGKQVATSAQEGLTDALQFFSKELRRV